MSLDLVGHRKAVTVVRACPRMIEYTDHKVYLSFFSIIKEFCKNFCLLL